MGRLLFLASVAFAFAMAVFPIVDNDVWWHLAVGRALAADHGFPATDLFSHTAATAPWDRHEWLFGLALYGLWTLGGAPALILAKAAFLAATAGVVWSTCRRRAAETWASAADLRPAVLATLVTAAVVMVFRSFALERPQIVTFLGFAALLDVLSRNDLSVLRRFRWLLGIAMVVWVNFHSGAAAGLLLVALFVGVSVWRTDLRPDLRLGSPTRELLIVLAILTAAFLVNPLGPGMMRFPLDAFTGRVNFPRIQEWQPPVLSDWRWFTGLLIVTGAVSLASMRRIRTEEVVLLLVFTPLALLYRRHVAFFALAAAPLLARLVPPLVESAAALLSRRLPERLREFFRPHPDHAGGIPGSALSLGCLGLLAFLTVRPFLGREILRLGVDEARYPSQIVRFLERENPPGKLFNLYDWGGYLAWTLGPARKVFIDGRLVLFGDVVRDYFQIQDGSDRWEELLDRHAVTVAAVSHDYGIAVRLAASTKWKLVHVDERGAIYVRDLPEMHGLIARRGYRWIHPDAREFSSEEGAAAALQEVDRALADDPSSSRLHYYRGQTLLLLRRPREAEDEMSLSIANNPSIANPLPFLARAAESRGDASGALRHWKAFQRLTGDPAAGERIARLSGESPAVPVAYDSPSAPLESATLFPAAVVRDNSPRGTGRNADAARQRNEAGLRYAQEGRTDRARDEWKQAVALDPENALAWTNLGGALLTLGDFDGAVAAFGRALEKNPKFAAAHYNLGYAFETRGRTADAVTAYHRALAADPSFERARAALARLERR